MSPAKLYHYTCGHSAKSIRHAGKLEPNEHPLLAGLKLVWLTDLDVPDVDALGLTSHILRCRRTEYRAVVDPDETVAHWPDFKRSMRDTASLKLLRGIRDLESAPGVLPMHWYVSFWPVSVESLEAVT